MIKSIKKALLLCIFILTPYIMIWGQSSYHMENNYAVFRDHPTAKGFDFKILVPNGWKIEESARSNEVCRLSYGQDSFTIIVLENVTFFSREDGRKFLDTGAFEESFLGNENKGMYDSKIISVSNTFIETYPARFIELEYKIQNPTDNRFYDYHSCIWVVCYEDLLVCAQTYSLKKNFSKVSLKFYEILRNLVFLNK